MDLLPTCDGTLLMGSTAHLSTSNTLVLLLVPTRSGTRIVSSKICKHQRRYILEDQI
jgi:hypothetical protein